MNIDTTVSSHYNDDHRQWTCEEGFFFKLTHIIGRFGQMSPINCGMFVSKVSLCHCLMNVSVFAVFPHSRESPLRTPLRGHTYFRDPDLNPVKDLKQQSTSVPFTPYHQVAWHVRCEDKILRYLRVELLVQILSLCVPIPQFSINQQLSLQKT